MTTSRDAGIVRIAAAGDSALVLDFPQRIDPEVNGRAIIIASELHSRWASLLRDVVVGYCTVTVYFDPLQVDAPWLESEMRTIAEAQGTGPIGSPGRLVEVPVCYDREFAADLEDVAAFARCSADEVVLLHVVPQYRVYMVGFVPGFTYLGAVNTRIAAPRRATPRAAVPAGSVAIAGGQTGIYPSDTPGGWNIIGRTPVKVYEPSRQDPFLLHTGDSVSFFRISRDDFERLR